MPADVYKVSFPGAITKRGFWLYVWKVKTSKGVFHYVGRTGDNSSPNATSPYSRMGQHLGWAKTQNALRKHLKSKELEPEDCQSYEFVCYGPIFPEVDGPSLDRIALMKKHLPTRNIVGALEKALAEAMSRAGYDVLNTVKWRHDLDLDLWNAVRDAFASEFPMLSEIT